jgi:hypothetical protein
MVIDLTRRLAANPPERVARPPELCSRRPRDSAAPRCRTCRYAPRTSASPRVTCAARQRSGQHSPGRHAPAASGGVSALSPTEAGAGAGITTTLPTQVLRGDREGRGRAGARYPRAGRGVIAQGAVPVRRVRRNRSGRGAIAQDFAFRGNKAANTLRNFHDHGPGRGGAATIQAKRVRLGLARMRGPPEARRGLWGRGLAFSTDVPPSSEGAPVPLPKERRSPIQKAAPAVILP